jgi:hypothetical protein
MAGLGADGLGERGDGGIVKYMIANAISAHRTKGSTNTYVRYPCVIA